LKENHGSTEKKIIEKQDAYAQGFSQDECESFQAVPGMRRCTAAAPRLSFLRLLPRSAGHFRIDGIIELQ
jgi:hypothetical protein